MEAYTGFAQVYDIFMDNVPYDRWVDYLNSLLRDYGINSGLVLELGCGTGKVTRRLANLGYDMIGIDNSVEMLELAKEKETKSENQKKENPKNEILENEILYLYQDMREFELFGTVAAVVSICDSLNYITSQDDLLKVFQLVNNYLDPGGIFIFDLNTEYKYNHVLADKTIAENRNDCSFIWDNYYDQEEKINEYNISIFVKINDEKEPSELFERFQETHYQRAYSIDTMIQLIERAGMEFVAVYDAFTRSKPTRKSERVYFVAREKYQKKKTYR